MPAGYAIAEATAVDIGEISNAINESFIANEKNGTTTMLKIGDRYETVSNRKKITGNENSNEETEIINGITTTANMRPIISDLIVEFLFL